MCYFQQSKPSLSVLSQQQKSGGSFGSYSSDSVKVRPHVLHTCILTFFSPFLHTKYRCYVYFYHFSTCFFTSFNFLTFFSTVFHCELEKVDVFCDFIQDFLILVFKSSFLSFGLQCLLRDDRIKLKKNVNKCCISGLEI